jgi:hypothetical protein
LGSNGQHVCWLRDDISRRTNKENQTLRRRRLSENEHSVITSIQNHASFLYANILFHLPHTGDVSAASTVLM